MAVDALKCKECGKKYPLEALFVCSECFGPLEVVYDYSGLDVEEAKRTIQSGPQSIWRYSEFLPFTERPKSRLATGLSPLIHAPRLGEYLGGLKNVYVKNEASNPTHSFKDRVVSVAMAKAQELGYEVIACASTGNLANAVAAHAAAAGLDSYVFIPTDLEEQKILATGVYGTELVGVKGNYDDVNRLCTELSAEYDWAFVNINMRPYYSEGSKTLAYEAMEQLGWKLPDRIVSPIASGSLFTKLYKGFNEWIDLAIVEGKTPVFHGAQATGCNPVANAFDEGVDFCKPVKPDTIAKSLAIGNPADGPYALDVARGTGGTIEQVTDDEIRYGIKLLAHTTGVFTETAGGVTVASLKKIAERGEIDPDETVVVYVTGEGLKTLDAARGTFEKYEIEPTVDAFNEFVPTPVTA
ncbi:MAG: threonine synthase [Solirubrobacterales bacterium]|nr:threonine synthase [Solirubrobacterales bacterium]